MNALAPAPLMAVPVVPRARRRGRRIGPVLLVSLGLHLLLAAALFLAPSEEPPVEQGSPSIEIVMGDTGKTAATETPEREAGVGATAAAPSDPSAPPSTSPGEPKPVEPSQAVPAPTPAAPLAAEPSPVARTPPPTPPARAPSVPETVRIEPPPPLPSEILPLPPPLVMPEPPPPPPPPPAPPVPRTPASPAPVQSGPRAPSPRRQAAPFSSFRPTFTFGGGLNSPGTMGTSPLHPFTTLPAGSASLGSTSQGYRMHMSGTNLGPDWDSLMRAWWEQHKYYPRQAAELGQDGMVTVTVHMGPDGRVSQVELAGRSGSQWLDMGAQSIFRGAKLPPFPWNETRKEAVMNFEIQYVLIR